MKSHILKAMRPHVCTKDGCGIAPNPRHEDCVEIDSEVFVLACNNSIWENGVRLAPD
jgi:hypothetical protein